MAGGRTGAQTGGFRVRMAFLQRFGKSQAAFRHNALRDFLHGGRALSTAYRGAKKYRIPSASGYGILRKE